jgi:DNA polymerase-3 subunit alpha
MSLGDQDEFRDGAQGWFAGIITGAERVATRKGQLMLNFTLEDLEGSIACVAFPQVYSKAGDQLTEDAIVRMRARVESSDLGRKLLVQEVQLLSDDGSFAKPPGTLCIRLDEAVAGNGGGARLKEILRRYPGRDQVEAHIRSQAGSEKVLRLPDELRVDSRSPGLHAELKDMLGDGSVWEQ